MHTSRTSVVIAACMSAAIAGAGIAQAAPVSHASAPSACRPANHLARITADRAESGHLHYRVTLTAPTGYEACRLVGSPTDVAFAAQGTALGVTTERYGDQNTVVTFGPGRPVHFDIRVPQQGRTTPADEASFTLGAPGGAIPGTSVADGDFQVATGTLIGPIRAGA
ncbi:DUF4232 domain-containing protein [Streptomyces sp. NPDC001568]|uniref:DUF4232 domain-containing protein n=1 Tax=Streptomyces sp. NPDC001568 TaxID=3364588 RepID=UPI0036777E2D